MKIESRVYALKNARGRKTGQFKASYGDVTTGSHESPMAASEALAGLILARCQHSSTNVNVVSVRGHVGVFSYDLQGYVETRHAWPNGHVSLVTGARDMREAEDSFRLHVAQQTWDNQLSGDCDILPHDKQSQFRDWCEWQLRYQHAKAQGMTDVQAHFYACDNRNPYSEAA